MSLPAGIVRLSPGARISCVQAVQHQDDRPADYAYETVELNGEPALQLWVPDSGNEIMYVSVQYELWVEQQVGSINWL